MPSRSSRSLPSAADVAVARGRLTQAEHLRDLAVAQALEVPQCQDLDDPSGSIQLRADLEIDLPLGPVGRLARRRGPPQELLRQRGGAGLRQRPPIERDLASGVAHLGPEVVTMDLHEPLARSPAATRGKARNGRCSAYSGSRFARSMYASCNTSEGSTRPWRRWSSLSRTICRRRCRYRSQSEGESGSVTSRGAAQKSLGIVTFRRSCESP